MCDDQILYIKRQLAGELLAVLDDAPAAVARQLLGLDSWRMSDLRSDRLNRFSVEKLIRLLAGVNRRVELHVVNSGPPRVQWIRILQERKRHR